MVMAKNTTPSKSNTSDPIKISILTVTFEICFLQLCNFDISQVVGRGAFGEEGKGGVRPQPLGQPWQVAVAHQQVVIDASANGNGKRLLF